MSPPYLIQNSQSFLGRYRLQGSPAYALCQPILSRRGARDAYRPSRPRGDAGANSEILEGRRNEWLVPRFLIWCPPRGLGGRPVGIFTNISLSPPARVQVGLTGTLVGVLCQR